MKIAAVIIFILGLSVGLAVFIFRNPALKEAREGPESFVMISPAFAENGEIPVKYTCKGQNISPPLEIKGIPGDTVSMAIIMHDPDAPSGDFLHWTIWNIGTNYSKFDENTVPASAIEGLTGFGKTGYGGPCPPSGSHHYIFDLYALKTKLNLPAGSTRVQLEKAMQGQIIAQTKLVGIVTAK